MRRTTFAIGLLAVALVGSNVWWAYKALDAGVTATYQEESFRAVSVSLKQHQAILGAVLKGDVKKPAILAAAQKAGADSDPFEKDGFTYVGWVGLKFDSNDRLVEVANE